MNTIRCLSALALILHAIAISGQSTFTLSGQILGHSGSQPLALSRFEGQESPFAEGILQDGNFKMELPKEAFQPGVYRLILAPRKYIDLIIPDTTGFALRAALDQPESTLTFSASPLNTRWYAYRLWIRQAQERIRALVQFAGNYPDPSATIYRNVTAEFDREAQELNFATIRFVKENKENLAGKMVANQPTPLPDIRIPLAGQEKQFQARYWQGINASDPDLLHTPVLVEHILAYFGFFLQGAPSPEADASLRSAVDTVMLHFGAHPMTARFARQFLTEGFKQLDKPDLLQYLDETYSAKEQCSSDMEDEELKKRLAAYQALSLGMRTPDITIPDFSGNATPMSQLRADTLLIVFWASWCPHCRSMLPALKEQMAGRKNWAVIAVSVDEDREAYTRTIAEYPEFRHYCDFKSWQTAPARDYHVNATPSFFLLDKDRILRGKFADLRQIPFPEK